MGAVDALHNWRDMEFWGDFQTAMNTPQKPHR
jgi:hypothetical protein